MNVKNDEFARKDQVIKEIESWFKIIGCNPDILIDNIKCLDGSIPYRCIDDLIYDIEHLRTTIRINWDGCCPDPEYPEIETVDISKEKLIALIKKHLLKDEEASKVVFGEIEKVDDDPDEVKVLNQPCLSTENNNITVNFRNESLKTRCPICNYILEDCQCRYGGPAHPDISKIREIVTDHLYMLSEEQLKHVIDLQRYWQISYGDDEKNMLLKDFSSKQLYGEYDHPHDNKIHIVKENKNDNKEI